MAGLVDEGVIWKTPSLMNEGVFSDVTTSIHEGVANEGVSTPTTGPQWQ